MIRVSTAACITWAAFAMPATAARLSSFDLPGQTAICGAAIADDGTVAGNTVAANPAVNFLYQDGVFTILPLAYARGQATVLGINRAHVMAGTNTVYGQNFTASSSGFLVYGTAARMVRVAVQVPGAVSIAVNAISNDDTIAGSYQTSQEGSTYGFIKRGDRITRLSDGSGATMPAGIDPGGANLVGTSLKDGAYSGWLYQAGKFTAINVTGAWATFAYGINRANIVSGTYFTGTPAAPVRHGYLFKGGKFATYDVPGASSTQFTGINAHGAVTGCYTNRFGTHGLVFVP